MAASAVSPTKFGCHKSSQPPLQQETRASRGQPSALQALKILGPRWTRCPGSHFQKSRCWPASKPGELHKSSRLDILYLNIFKDSCCNMFTRKKNINFQHQKTSMPKSPLGLALEILFERHPTKGWPCVAVLLQPLSSAQAKGFSGCGHEAVEVLLPQGPGVCQTTKAKRLRAIQPGSQAGYMLQLGNCRLTTGMMNMALLMKNCAIMVAF